MTGSKDATKMGIFRPSVRPKDLFSNLSLLLLYPYNPLTLCKKSEKTNKKSPRCLQTEHSPQAAHRRTMAFTKDPNG